LELLVTASYVKSLAHNEQLPFTTTIKNAAHFFDLLEPHLHLNGAGTHKRKNCTDGFTFSSAGGIRCAHPKTAQVASPFHRALIAPAQKATAQMASPFCR
jgi:hypothetical protein